jgi:hypothetical protein
MVVKLVDLLEFLKVVEKVEMLVGKLVDSMVDMMAVQ